MYLPTKIYVSNVCDIVTGEIMVTGNAEILIRLGIFSTVTFSSEKIAFSKPSFGGFVEYIGLGGLLT